MIGVKGIILRDLPGDPQDLPAALAGVEGLGPDVRLLQVPDPSWLSPGLDRGRLRDAHARAEAAGVELTAGVGSLNPNWPGRMALLERFGDSPLDGVSALSRAAADAGIRALHFTVGHLEDRFAAEPDWAAQLAQARSFVREAAARAAEHGIALVLKTHEEMTIAETLTFVESADPFGLGIGFSPVNLLVRLEHALTELPAVLPHLHSLFLDDAALHWTPAGFARAMQPFGEGSIPWGAILATVAAASAPVALVLDLHRAEFELPVFDAEWPGRPEGLDVFTLMAFASEARPRPAVSAGLGERRARGHDVLLSL